jgi:hypothetical protein
MIKSYWTVLFLIWAGYSFAQQRPASEKPNVVIILTDDQGYADVGFNGSKDIPTPGIDSIAKNGVVFRAGYVSYAVCGPSRAGLITGRYQDRFGFSRNPLLAPKDSTMILEKEIGQLFDIQSDLSESKNVISADLLRKNSLSEKIDQWKMLLMDPVFLGLLEDKEYSRLHPDRFTPEIKKND